MSSQRRKVLIVEDDSTAYTGLRRLLEHYGCEVIYAGTVADALKCLDDQPEFVFLDLGLPDGEGTRVLERVKMTNLASRVIVVSGMTEESVLWRARALDPYAVLGKPVDFLEVLELMEPAA